MLFRSLINCCIGRFYGRCPNPQKSSSESVSYTHLDVYKRQDVYLAMEFQHFMMSITTNPALRKMLQEKYEEENEMCIRDRENALETKMENINNSILSKIVDGAEIDVSVQFTDGSVQSEKIRISYLSLIHISCKSYRNIHLRHL